jgi:hypothetical protein
MDVDSVAEVSEVYAISIFRVKVGRLMSACISIALCLKSNGVKGGEIALELGACLSQ